MTLHARAIPAEGNALRRKSCVRDSAAFIPESAPSEKPVFIAAKGLQYGAFRRIGSSDQRCNEDDLRHLFQSASTVPYEETFLSDATTGDLDPEIIDDYRYALVKANPTTALSKASDDLPK